MCLLFYVVLGVQSPRKEPLQEAAARSFLVVLLNHDAPDHEMAVALHCTAAAIFIDRW